MEQRISLITLGVADLQRAVVFYERVVGWKAESSPPGIVFFDLNGVVFALWPHNELAKDTVSVLIVVQVVPFDDQDVVT